MLNLKQKEMLKILINEYGEARASKYYMDDQGNGRDVDIADEQFNICNKALFDYIEEISYARKRN